MNIVLTSIHISNTPDALPLAPVLLKSYAEQYNKCNFSIDIAEFTISANIDDVVKDLLSRKPDIIGFSIYLWNREYYIELCKLLKEKRPDIIIVAGGAEIRSSYIKLLEVGIDFTIQGEGEEVFSQLLSSIIAGEDCSKIDGINDGVNRSIDVLDSIPSPLLTKNIDLSKYDGYLWELSRGCPFNCDFCFESRGVNGVRYYSMDRITDELNMLIHENVNQVFVLDPTFNKDLVRAKKILKLIKNSNCNIHFHFEVRAEFLDREICQLFSDINASLQIGIQSGNDDVLKLVNRRLNKKVFTAKTDLLNECGTIFGLDLIYGLPGDDYQGFKESMEYVLSLQPNHLDIFPLSVLPGTALFDNASNLKLQYLENTPYTVISSNTYSKFDMIKSEKLKSACDFIYNKCKSTAWFIQVVKELQVNCTDFIESFSNYYDVNKLCSLSEIEYIKKYIREIYRPKNINLIDDMINYHAAYSKALLGEKLATKHPKKRLKEMIPSLSKTSSYIEFSFPMLDLFDEGIFEISQIKKVTKQQRSKAIIWFHTGGEIIFECYSKQIMNFIKNIDGVLTCSQIDKQIDVDFLLFAQESGLIYFN